MPIIASLPTHLHTHRPVLTHIYAQTRTHRHNMDFSQINEAFDLLHSGKTLRTVLTFKQ